MKIRVTGCALVLAALFSTTPLAHHSAAGVDQTKSVTIVGVLQEFKWANPHSWMDIDVSNDKGETTRWSVEMTAPAYLARAGWTSKTVKPGDKVTVTVRPMKNGDPGGLFVSITLPDGRVLGQAPAAPRPNP
jgi:hypothetical protein